MQIAIFSYTNPLYTHPSTNTTNDDNKKKQDDFNLTGLSAVVPYYDYALDMILDADLPIGAFNIWIYGCNGCICVCIVCIRHPLFPTDAPTTSSIEHTRQPP